MAVSQLCRSGACDATTRKSGDCMLSNSGSRWRAPGMTGMISHAAPTQLP